MARLRTSTSPRRDSPEKNIQDALRQWRFAPFRVSDKMHPVETGISLDFKPAGAANR